MCFIDFILFSAVSMIVKSFNFSRATLLYFGSHLNDKMPLYVLGG